ncbi:MAG: isoprenylcysteine carboxyl methyltransferase [Halioglobus sp.]
MNGPSAPPASATNLYINCAALLASLVTFWWLLRHGAALTPQAGIFLLGASYALPIIALEALWRKPLPQVGRGDARAAVAVPRVLVKLLGLGVTALLVVAVYRLFPEYRGAFYNRYYQALLDAAPWGAGMAIPYFFWMDRRSGGEQDGYWHLGQAALLQWRRVDHCSVGQHLLGWLVKLFFLPLMFIYFCDKLDYYRSYDFTQVFASFRTFYDFAFQALFYIDLLIAFVGYVCTFRATDSHIRSTEPTLLGWAVALVCYQPFWSFFSAQYIHYETSFNWGGWLGHYPALYAAWGSAILLLTGVYVWATLSFGIRFSNLTHRGILTNGAYRFCKHPAYVSKNLSWWMISMPFMVSGSIGESLRHCALLLLLNGIYLLRARTEERHLSQDADYRAYARYIEDHGLFRELGRRLPVLRFQPGRLFNVP